MRAAPEIPNRAPARNVLFDSFWRATLFVPLAVKDPFGGGVKVQDTEWESTLVGIGPPIHWKSGALASK